MSNGKYKEQTAEERHELVRRIGQELGPDWTYRNPVLNGDSGLAHWAELLHKHGYALSFTSQWPTHALHVSGVFPRDHHFPSDEKRPSINVNPEKPPAQIAKDITRRLLPEYVPKWEKGVDAQRQRDAYAAAQKALTEELLSILPPGAGSVPNWTKDRNTINVHLSGIHGEIECFNDSCMLKLRSIPCQLAKDIIRLLVAIQTAPQATWECSDPRCPVHKGVSSCANEADTTVTHIEMDTPASFDRCADCASRALQSGVSATAKEGGNRS